MFGKFLFCLYKLIIAYTNNWKQQTIFYIIYKLLANIILIIIKFIQQLSVCANFKNNLGWKSYPGVWSIVSVSGCHEKRRPAEQKIKEMNHAFKIRLFCLGAIYSRWIFVSTECRRHWCSPCRWHKNPSAVHLWEAEKYYFMGERQIVYDSGSFWHVLEKVKCKLIWYVTHIRC